MILAQQLLFGVLANGAELVVYVRDGTLHISDRNDGVLIQRELLVGQFFQRSLAGGEAFFQCLLGLCALPNLPSLQIHPAGQRNCLRHQGYKRRRRDHGHGRRDCLNHARQQVAAVPDVPNLHQVGRAASQDEAPEHPENPVEGEITILADKIDENDRNAVIRERDQAI